MIDDYISFSAIVVSMATKAPRPGYHHGDLRRTLIDVATAVVETEGEDAVSVRDIARRAGVSAAAPFRHFRDKEELLDAVAAEAMVRFRKLMDEATREVVGEPLLEFRALGLAYVRLAVRHPKLFALAFRRAGADPAGAESIRESRARVERARAKGAIVDADPDLIVLAAGAMTQGLCRMIVEGQLGKVTVKEAERLCAGALDILGHGLLPRPDDC